MSKVGHADTFVSSIVQQQLFKVFLQTNLSKTSVPALGFDKLVCRGNSDVFLANRNMVRCCTINGKKFNYRLLDNNSSDNFDINSLEMNSSGTLMALVGKSDVVIISLPNNVGGNAATIIPTKLYRLQGIGGDIKKVIWHSAVGNDCSLVILNSRNEVKCYDISISLDVPQINVNLSKFDNFDDEHATSIAFGTDSSLLSSLTLYITTTKSHVYSIYPFTYRNANLVSTKEKVEEAVAESIATVKAVEKRFPSSSVMDSFESPLKEASLRQYKYVKDLVNQINSGIPLKHETRGLYTSTPHEFLVLEQNLPVTFEPLLQGPLYTSLGSGISDILSVKNSKGLTVLITIGNKDADNVYVTYLTQLRPLIMKWKQFGDILKSLPQIPAKSKHQKSLYERPKKGFGFVLTPEEDEETESETNSDSELKFWGDEYTMLNLINVDELSLTSGSGVMSLKSFTNDRENFGIIINNKVIFAELGVWYNTLFDIASGNSGSSLPNFSVNYTALSSSVDTLVGTDIINDVGGQSGEYLIIFRGGDSNNLEIVSITENGVEEEEAEEESVDDEESTNLIADNILKSRPFEELVRDVDSLKRFEFNTLAKYVDPSLSAKTIQPTTEILDAINKVSSKVVDEVSKSTSYTVKLNSRLLIQLEQLRTQIASMRNLPDVDIAKLEEYKKKLVTLTENQVKLEEKSIKLKGKLEDSVDNLKNKKSLPLADSEIQWFKEINVINGQISHDSSSGPSLQSVVKSLKDQTQSLLEEMKSIDTKEGSDFKLKRLETDQKLFKLKCYLEENSQLINVIKSKLESK
ncbi:hypothetical protein DFJ63DRAFT_311897 [Scheffersomyces coipomensis]|uniref:uncharacterized protein n=1 Tax=Scheffersomyces coipomensis TaxID=1788519 RepID=UPI00315D0FE4